MICSVPVFGISEWGFSLWVHNAYSYRLATDGTWELVDDAGKVVNRFAKEADAINAAKVANSALQSPTKISLIASKNFNKQSHGGRAKQFLEELTGTKITEKLKTPEGTLAVLRGWEEQIQNGILKAKGQYFDPARPSQVFEVFEGGGFTLLRSLNGELISVQRSTFDMIKRLLPKI